MCLRVSEIDVVCELGHLVMEYVIAYAGFMCVCEIAMYICGASCVCMPVHVTDKVCIGLCAFEEPGRGPERMLSKPASDGGGF